MSFKTKFFLSSPLESEQKYNQSQLLIEPIWCHVTCLTGEFENFAFVALPASPRYGAKYLALIGWRPNPLLVPGHK